MCADGDGTINPLFDVNREPGPQCLADGLALQHHPARDFPRPRIGADCLKRRMRQRADRVE